MDKKSISVPEMRRILGLGKTESYWLIKKGYFKTIMLFGKIRVMTDSFEEWYANQFHYKKTDGSRRDRIGGIQCQFVKQPIYSALRRQRFTL